MRIESKKLVLGPGSLMGRDSFYHVKENYIDNLGLNNELMSRYTLDIAGGDSTYASFVGNNVVSIDSAANSYYQMSPQNAQVDAEDLPFGDNEFELVISSQGLPFLYHIAFETPEEVRSREMRSDDVYDHEWIKNLSELNVSEKLDSFLSEAIRVTKAGGQMRFWPIIEHPSRNAITQFKSMLDDKLKKLSQQGTIQFKYVATGEHEDIKGAKIGVYRLEIIKN